MEYNSHKDGDMLVDGLRRLEKLAIEKAKRERFLIWLLRRVDERNHEIVERRRHESGNFPGSGE